MTQQPPQANIPQTPPLPQPAPPVGDFSYKGELKKAIEIIKLNEKVMGTVAKDAKAFNVAIGIIVLAGVASFVGMYLQFGKFASMSGLFGVSLFSLIQSAIFGVLMYVGFIWVLAFIAQKQGSKVTFQELLRVLGYGNLIGWAAIIPLLGIVGIWNVVIAYKSLVVVGGLKGEKAIFTLLGGVLAMIAVITLVGLFGLNTPYGLY